MSSDELIKKLEQADGPEAATLLKLSLRRFISVFHWYVRRKQFTFKPFHLRIIKALEDLVFERQRNIIINMPVRWGKSALVEYFIAWTYAINPQCNNIYTSYSDELVRKFSGEIKDIVESPLYNKLFGLSIRNDSSNKSLWKVSGGGEMRAVSMGGAVTGFGAGDKGPEYAGALIIDDPQKPSEARSEAMKTRMIDYWENTLSSRRNNTELTPIIIIMQRLAVDDLVGVILERGLDYELIKIPALDETGNSAWPEQVSAESLVTMRRESPYLFYSQYQQEPFVPTGSVIHVNKFRRYDEAPQVRYTKVFADTAFTAKTSSDYSVFLLAGYDLSGNIYVLDVWRGKWEVPQLTEFAGKLWTSFMTASKLPYPRPRALCIENRASGIGLLQTLRQNKVYVQPLEPKTRDQLGALYAADKFQRVCDILPALDQGKIFLPADGLKKSWLPDFIKECAEFTADGTHAHDDQVDCLVYSVKELEGRLHAIF